MLIFAVDAVMMSMIIIISTIFLLIITAIFYTNIYRCLSIYLSIYLSMCPANLHPPLTVKMKSQ